MNPSNYHSAIINALRSSYGMSEVEAESFLNRVDLVRESQQFLTSCQRLPVASMKLAVGFVNKYMGVYPHAKFRDLGYNKYELAYYRFEDGVRVGLGLVLRHGETSMYQLVNANGSEAITGNKTIFL